MRLSDGSIAWSHATTGRVVAAAWAPIGTEIAYVVESHGRAQLRMIEGDGDHDKLIDSSVSAVTPSWRADSLALAYAGADGQLVVRDLARRSSTVIRPGIDCPLGRTTQVAFAPRGSLLAASGDGGTLVADPGRWVRCTPPINIRGGPLAPPPRLAWISGQSLIESQYQWVARLLVRGRRVDKLAQATAPTGINGLTVSPDRRQIAIGFWRNDRLQLVVAEMPQPGDTALRIVRVLRELPNPSAARNLIWR